MVKTMAPVSYWLPSGVPSSGYPFPVTLPRRAFSALSGLIRSGVALPAGLSCRAAGCRQVRALRDAAYPRCFRHSETLVSMRRRMASGSDTSAALTNGSPVIFS